MKFGQIATIKQSLDKLGEQKLPIAYEIAKNIRACNKVMEEVRALSREMLDKYVDRNEDGEVKTYEENGQAVTKVTDPEKIAAYRNEIFKLDNDDFEVTFTKIPFDKIANKDLEANLILPLLDVIIIE